MLTRIKCAVPGCSNKRNNAKYLMCFYHWRLVPEVLQKTIWRLYNNGNPRDGHVEACTNAVEQVVELTTKREP